MNKKTKIVKVVRCSMLLPILFLVLLAGCAGPMVANDLLVVTEKLDTPLVENGYSIRAEINPQINNSTKIDIAVKESLDIALKESNIFSTNQGLPYMINANVEIASQANFSFGSFEGTLQVKYTVYDEGQNLIFDKTIYSEAGSDKFIFSGAKRYARARAVNIAKNVLEFIEYLKTSFKER